MGFACTQIHAAKAPQHVRGMNVCRYRRSPSISDFNLNTCFIVNVQTDVPVCVIRSDGRRTTLPTNTTKFTNIYGILGPTPRLFLA